MTVYRIRYRVQNQLKPHPLRYLKEKLLALRDFLLPTVYQCRPTVESGEGAAAKAAAFLREYEAFYEGKPLGENVTQMYRHQLRLVANAVYKAAQQRRSEELRVLEANQEKAREVRRLDPEFSLHSFLSNVRNKVASIHYAQTAEQLEAFTTAPLAGVIEQYRDVMDCRFGPVALENYAAEGDIRRAQVSMKLKLLRLEGQKVSETQETLRLRLTRRVGAPSRNPFGIHSLRCGTCGHSLDLTEGNICRYCGNHWDLSQYDWCVSEYSFN